MPSDINENAIPFGMAVFLLCGGEIETAKAHGLADQNVGGITLGIDGNGDHHTGDNILQGTGFLAALDLNRDVGIGNVQGG